MMPEVDPKILDAALFSMENWQGRKWKASLSRPWPSLVEPVLVNRFKQLNQRFTKSFFLLLRIAAPIKPTEQRCGGAGRQRPKVPRTQTDPPPRTETPGGRFLTSVGDQQRIWYVETAVIGKQ
ncbi:unnamed protein product [Citrullus colocynthis]|uniref:Uncharacterized protein n=1 Tax=Citrullus colocynthis TaxID=252529 RepID=A0ABP0Z237_9ROSI